MSKGAPGGGATPRVRPAAARGRVAMQVSGAGAIDATEAFSRGDAIDRAWMGWGALRVLSRQEWAPGTVRDEGRVANVERLLLVLDGVLEADCGRLGRHRVAADGALWIGTGHGAEARMANASRNLPLRLVECWLRPDRVNATPAVATCAVGVAMGVDAGPPGPGDGERPVVDAWATLAAGDASVGAADPTGPRGPVPSTVLPLRQRARVMSARIGPGATLALPTAGAGRYWLEVLEGDVIATGADMDGGVDPGGVGLPLAAGDGVGWLAGARDAPRAVAAPGPGRAWLLLLALPA